MTTPTTTDPATGRPPPSKPRAKTVPGEDGLRRLPGVVLFTAGTHRDMRGRTREYTRDYLDGVVKNFAALRADKEFHVEPPAVLGHEVVQAKLAEILSGDETFQKHFADTKASPGGGPGRTDQLAAGWPENVRLDGDSIVADLERIPPSVADLIDSGQLRYPSVEFQETGRRADGTPVPPHLFRVALLGGTPPGCKAVPPLGDPHFADLPDGVIAFADATGTMPADETAQKPSLKTLRLHHPTISDKTMGMLTKPVIESLFEDANANAEGGAGGDAHAQLVAAYVKAGLGDQAAAQAMTDDALKQALSQAGVTSMADTNTTTQTPDPKAAELAKQKADLTAFADSLKAEIAEAQKALEAQGEAIRRAAESATASQKTRADAEWAAAVDAFCDAQAAASRIAPFELDPKNPTNLRVRLKAIPADELLCFADPADGTKEIKLPRRQVELDEIKKRPVRMFGDRIGTKPGQPDDPDAVTPARKKELLAHYGSLGRVALDDMQKAVARN